MQDSSTSLVAANAAIGAWDLRDEAAVDAAIVVVRAFLDEYRRRVGDAISLASISTSDFQFRYNLIGQHGTREAQAQQAALEGLAAAGEVRRILRDRERALLDLADILDRQADTDRAARRRDLDADEKRHEIAESERALAIRLHRWQQAAAEWRRLGGCSVADFEAGEARRWRSQTLRAAALDVINRQAGGGIGNLGLLWQLGDVPQEHLDRIAVEMFGKPLALPGGEAK